MILLLFFTVLNITGDRFALSGDGRVPEQIQSLVQAELDFAEKASLAGTRSAFLSVLAEESVVFRPGLVDARKWFTERPEDTGRLVWRPLFADVASAGDLGYTTGPWIYHRPDTTSADTVYGHYISIWQRNVSTATDTSWKLILDVGISHPQPSIPLSQVTEYEVPSDMYTFRSGTASSGPDLPEKLTLYADSLYYDDAVRAFFPQKFPIRGKESLEKYVAGFSEKRRYVRLKDDVSLNHDMAYSYGRIEQNGTYTHMFLQIFKKTGKGWRCVLEVWNDLPAEN